MTMLDEYGDVLTIADLQEILSIGRKRRTPWSRAEPSRL